MSRTKEEIAAIIKDKLVKKHFDSITFTDLMALMSNASAPQQQAFLNAIKNRDGKRLTTMLFTALNQEADRLASIEADDMLLDDSLNLTEIDRIL